MEGKKLGLSHKTKLHQVLLPKTCFRWEFCF